MASPATGQTFEQVVRQRLSRRGLLKAGLVVSAAAAAPLVNIGSARLASARAQPMAGGLAFAAIAPDKSDQITVANDYRAQVLLRWGDPLQAGAPGFDVAAQTVASQEQRFGFNCDFVMYLPLPQGGSSVTEGLLWVNHEYTDGRMMFPGYEPGAPTLEQANIEQAAHGGSVVHIRKGTDGTWTYDPASRWNRRITATTPIRISGPAAGDAQLRTTEEPTGTAVLGTLNNCGGGATPWGTILTAEENFNMYFANLAALPDGAPKSALRRYGIPNERSRYGWEAHHARFDVSQAPNEPNRFGWIVEVDPYEPGAQPVKRTALGRLKHEAATSVVAPSGQVVVYTGDDERFDYVYKFVSARPYDPGNRQANMGLLDTGTLYVARFNDDGSGDWLPLVFGQGPLNAANGWANQADVLIRARQAGDALGATKMDRPEDIEVNPLTGKVYAVMTYNEQRGEGNRPAVDAANPRADNRWGHIIEWAEADNDPSATSFRWELFLLCGDPADASTYFAGYPKEQVSALAAPDNIAFDGRGNLWIATDGMPTQLNGWNDGVFAVPTEGPARGQVKQFLSAVIGCETASLVFNTNDDTLFVSIQHPGEGGSLARPTSVWPQAPDGPALPGVIAVTRVGGGAIGQ